MLSNFETAMYSLNYRYFTEYYVKEKQTKMFYKYANTERIIIIEITGIMDSILEHTSYEAREQIPFAVHMYRKFLLTRPRLLKRICLTVM